ncbi:MAG: hypothetical protein OXF75_02505 [Acidimicrobiaceae bacterium]|nr:hypothetical protein [Acidimicrobiaceae bacterium]
MNPSDDFAPVGIDTVLAAARDTDGLEDFGPVGFQEPLGVLLAADERHCAACGWEIGEAAPRIGWQPDTGDPRIGDRNKQPAKNLRT